MNFLKKLWQDIRARKNLDIYITILLAVTIGVLGAFGVVNIEVVSASILTTLALITISLLQNRRDNDDIKTLLEKFEKRQDLAGAFFVDEFNPYLLKASVQNSRKAFFWGVTLTTTMQVLDHAIEQGLKAGLEARFLLIKPNSSAIEMTAFRNWFKRDAKTVNSTLNDSLHRLAVIANETKYGG